jgi:hypothetical protein
MRQLTCARCHGTGENPEAANCAACPERDGCGYLDCDCDETCHAEVCDDCGCELAYWDEDNDDDD